MREVWDCFPKGLVGMVNESSQKLFLIFESLMKLVRLPNISMNSSNIREGLTEKKT